MRVNAQTGRSRLAHVSLTVEVNHIEHLNNILKKFAAWMDTAGISRRWRIMRAVVQRVTSGAVSIGGQEVARIGRGLVVLIGVAQNDTENDASYIAGKITGLRILKIQTER